MLRYNAYIKMAGCIAIGLMTAIICHTIYSKINTPETVTVMTQSQAESVNGVQSASSNAQVPLSVPQAKEVVAQIKEIHTTEQVPIYIVQSTGETVEEDIEQARVANDADFSVVATPDDKPVDMNELKQADKVEIAQYNVQAYKKHINTISYAPQPQIIGYEHQWKVSKDGKYMGIGVDHDLDDNKTYLKVTYSW